MKIILRADETRNSRARNTHAEQSLRKIFATRCDGSVILPLHLTRIPPNMTGVFISAGKQNIHPEARMSRSRRLSACVLALTLLAAPKLNQHVRAQASGEQSSSTSTLAALPYFTEPALAPDRSEIAFVSGGDIWTVPAAGGAASLLVSHTATESRPLYSPDGKSLAFVSTRTGNGDIYVLTLDTGDLRRMTFDDAFDALDAWSRDGRWLYFSSTSRDIAGMNDLFRVSVDGGTPMQVSADRYVNEYFSAPAPDGATLAFTARGIVSQQWWR